MIYLLTFIVTISEIIPTVMNVKETFNKLKV